MEVQPDFRDLIELFNKYKVDYIIVGAYAPVNLNTEKG